MQHTNTISYLSGTIPNVFSIILNASCIPFKHGNQCSEMKSIELTIAENKIRLIIIKLIIESAAW